MTCISFLRGPSNRRAQINTPSLRERKIAEIAETAVEEAAPDAEGTVATAVVVIAAHVQEEAVHKEQAGEIFGEARGGKVEGARKDGEEGRIGVQCRIARK